MFLILAIPNMMDQFINFLLCHGMVQEFSQLSTHFPRISNKTPFRLIISDFPTSMFFYEFLLNASKGYNLKF